jgi:hypothetical protein
MGILEISLMVAAGVLGYIFGHENGRRNTMQEMVALQEYEQSKQLWEQSMKNLTGRFYDEDDDDDEEEN